MKSCLLSTAAAVAASMLTMNASANTLYFQMNPNFDDEGVRQAFVFGAANATGTISGGTGFSQSFDLGAEGFAVVTIPVTAELGSAVIENKGFQISSTTNVSGYFLNRRDQSSDITYLIDGDRLGTDYVVAGYQNISEDQVSVQATADNTVVTFTPKGAAAFNVTLNAGQTYLYTDNINLTGSRVTSDKPIALFSGNRCTNVPTNIGFCDHIVEQIPSVDVLSTTYLVAQTPRTGTAGNVVRIIATENDTEVRYNGAVVATLASGDFYEGRVVGGNVIEATKKVLVTEYLIGQDQANANTDPAMTIVPGSDQWLKSYVFATPSGSADFPTDFASIIIRTDDLSTLTVAGILADTSTFNALGTTAFSFGNIDVSLQSGPFSITAANPFQLLLSGFDDFDSYFTYGGAAFSPGASPPPTPTPPGTALFWDGDAEGNADNGIVDGGDGTWTASTNTFTVDSGVTNNSDDPEPSVVFFGGVGGTVTVDTSEGDIAVSGMNFTVDGYSLVGDPIILAGTSAVLDVGDGTEAGALITTRIDSQLTGTAGLTKVGLGTLTLTAANDYAGDTNAQAGTLIGNVDSFGVGNILISGGAEVRVDHSLAAATLPNLVNGTGSFVKQGTGTLTITGENGLSGGTTVAAGRLDVDGDLGLSVVEVQSGATLGGNGTVGGVVALAGSTIAPGNSIGTLTVDGDYSQAAGSVYQVELESTGANDRILVSGAADIESGAVIDVVKLDAPRLVLNTRYTVLTADEGVTGTYTLTGATRVSAFINVLATYDANNVYLGVTKNRAFAAAGATPNQIAAARGADSPSNGALFTAIAYLQTDGEARSAFDQISGEIHASVRHATFEDSRFVREGVVNHLTSPEDAQRGIWMHAYGSWGSVDGDGNGAEIDRDIGGFFIGGDIFAGNGLTAGILAGYGSATIRVDDRASSAKTDDYHVGAYFGFESGGFGARLGTAYMWRDVKTNRSVSFTGFSDSLRGDYRTRVFQLFGDFGYNIAIGGAGLEPFLALAYVNVDTETFREAGGLAALRSDGDQSLGFWTSTLGGRATFGIGTGTAITAMAGWRHTDGATLTTPLRVALAGGPVYSIDAPPIAEDVASLGLKVTSRLGPNIDGDLGYSGQVGGGLKDHGVKASIRLRF